MTATATVSAVAIRTPIHLAAADPASSARYAPDFAAAYTALDGRTVLAATNGKMLAVVPTESVDAAPGRTLISRDALKSVKRSKRNPAPLLHLTDAGTYNPANGCTYPAVDGSYPPVADVFPKPDAMAGRIVLHFNAALLAELAESMGCENGGVCVIVDATANSMKPMVVMPAECERAAYGTGAVALLMPLTSDRKPAAAIAEATERIASVSAVIKST